MLDFQDVNCFAGFILLIVNILSSIFKAIIILTRYHFKDYIE